ncbi:MAG: hypothetical protein AAGA97_02645 [Pseudomonadota bacterium]
MPWDPFEIDEYHKSVTQRILDREPGLAQSVIGVDLASYEVREIGGVPVGHLTTAGPSYGREAMEELILDIARGDGRATTSVFSRDRVNFMIKDREAYNDNWLKKKNELAALLALVENDPDLFY